MAQQTTLHIIKFRKKSALQEAQTKDMETNPCDSKHRLSSNTHRLRGRKAILNPWGQYQGSIQGFRKTKGAQEMICLVTKTT